MKAVKYLKLMHDDILTGPIYVSWAFREFHRICFTYLCTGFTKTL